MTRSWGLVAGTALFAIGAIGMAIWLWVMKRKVGA
jgi:preprotein translocase subunit Sss1